MSADASVNNAERLADYWVFGGIFRPVFLEAMPKTFIDYVAIDAKADGNFKMQVFTKIYIKMVYTGKSIFAFSFNISFIIVNNIFKS